MAMIITIRWWDTIQSVIEILHSIYDIVMYTKNNSLYNTNDVHYSYLTHQTIILSVEFISLQLFLRYYDDQYYIQQQQQQQ